MTASLQPPASLPDDPAVLVEAAKLQHQANQLDAAAELYNRALALAPDQIEALYLLGALNFQQGRFEDAVALLERCRRLAPGHGPALEALTAARVQLCAVLAQIARWPDCAACARACLTDAPNQPDALYLLATSLRALGRWGEAGAAYAEALAVNPERAAARDEYGAVLFELGRYEDAEREIRAALALDPARAVSHTNLGRLLVRNPAKAAEALHHHDLCLAALPDYAEAHNNRAAALYALNRLTEAETACRSALALKPTLAEAQSNLGNILQRQGKLSEAIAAYRAALSLNPNFAEAQWNLGLIQLSLGQFADGWDGFEARWRCRDFVTPDRSHGLPRADLTGPPTGPVLVWGEQGVGDEIVYGSMVADLAATGAKVLFECDDRLRPLWQRSLHDVAVVGRSDNVSAAVQRLGVTAQIPVASLGPKFRPAEACFPPHGGYLKPDARRREALRQHFSVDGKLVVAISWLSRNDELGSGKSAPLTAWRPILATPKVRFVTAQYGDTTRERQIAGTEIVDASVDLFNDLDGTAALLAACDLVITVSNTTAHLAGALGVPVWVLAPSGVGKLWYWFTGRTDTPWYPSARLYRQQIAGAWDAPIAEIARDLAGLAARR